MSLFNARCSRYIVTARDSSSVKAVISYLTTATGAHPFPLSSAPFLSLPGFPYTHPPFQTTQHHISTLVPKYDTTQHNMFTPLRSLGLGLLLCSPALAVIRDPPTFKDSSLFYPRDANASATLPECGHGAGIGNETCPLNVCCSEFGNCGTTADFCGKGCQNNCDLPETSDCATKSSSSLRTVGYYESWANTRKCQNLAPKDLNVTGFTHINYAFLGFDPNTFAIAETAESDKPLATEFTNLKTANPGLKTWIAIGGWNFNEVGPTRTAFSDMVSCPENRTKFINEIKSFMQTYAFDGLDIDWEYPSDPDRGGKTADTANLALFTKEARAAFGTQYGLSVTLPSGYLYMRNFDLAGMAEHVDFFNLMSYDIHGIWDKNTTGGGPYILPHTNLTEIEVALELLWRSKVPAEKVNLGLAWYGRSYTLAQPNCTTPNGVCEFSEAGFAGSCSDAAGTLDLQEIQDIIAQENSHVVLDDVAAVKYMAYNKTQWISYDDEETIKLKQQFADKKCLGGTMVWAMDQADQKTACGFPAAVRPPPSTSGNSTAPAGCSTMQVSAGNTTCTSIVATSGTNFTVAQLQAWNPQIASCDSLTVGESICISPPGGWYVLAQPALPAPNATSPGASTSATAGGDAPAATQSGIAADCTSFATAKNGSACTAFAEDNKISLAHLYEWNPILGVDGKNCSKAFQADTSYCIGVGSSDGSASSGAASATGFVSGSASSATATATAISVTTTAATTASGSNSAPPSADATAPAPSEVQSGISPACNAWATPKKQQGCIDFASDNHITLQQLYDWNKILGTDCKALQFGYKYCVGIGNGPTDPTGVPTFSPPATPFTLSTSLGASGMSSTLAMNSSVASIALSSSAASMASSVASSALSSSDAMGTGSMVESAPSSSESVATCSSTVTSSVTQTVTSTVFQASSAGSESA